MPPQILFDSHLGMVNEDWSQGQVHILSSCAGVADNQGLIVLQRSNCCFDSCPDSGLAIAYCLPAEKHPLKLLGAEQ